MTKMIRDKCFVLLNKIPPSLFQRMSIILISDVRHPMPGIRLRLRDIKFFFVVVVLLTRIDLARQASLKNNEQKLREYIFPDYASDVRPLVNSSRPINITMDVEFMQVVSVDEQLQHVSLKLWLRFKWTNELLVWKPERWNGISVIKVNPALVWKPDIILYNLANRDLTDSMDSYQALMHVRYDGLNYWVIRLMSTTSCQLNVRYFPFDNQLCILKFGSWAYNSNELDLIRGTEPFITSYFANSSEWHLHEIYKVVQKEQFKALYSTMVIRFTLSRKPLYYIFNVVIPCILLIFVVMINFFLPPTSGERIGLTITVLLAFTIFFQMVQRSLPTTSTSIPLLSVFYITVMVESAFTLLTTCIVLLIHHRGDRKGMAPLPQWVRKYLLNGIGAQLGFPTVELHINICSPQRENYIFESNVDSEAKGSPSRVDLLSDGLEHCGEGSKIQAGSTCCHYCGELLKEVNVITSFVKRKEIDEHVEKEWQLLSLVLDRISFWIFLATFMVSSIALLVPAGLIHTWDT